MWSPPLPLLELPGRLLPCLPAESLILSVQDPPHLSMHLHLTAFFLADWWLQFLLHCPLLTFLFPVSTVASQQHTFQGFVSVCVFLVRNSGGQSASVFKHTHAHLHNVFTVLFADSQIFFIWRNCLLMIHFCPHIKLVPYSSARENIWTLPPL